MSIEANSRFFVTGATGLVGSHFLYKLSEKHQIRALTRDLSRKDQVKELFKFYDVDSYESKWNNIQWVEGDLEDFQLMEEYLKDADYVIHAAAFVSFVRKDFNKLLKINFEGTRNLVNACLVSDIKKILYLSSVSVFGKNEHGNLITEKNRWKNSPDNSGYANSKYLAEREVWRGFEEGLSGVIVNPSIIFGPGNPNESSNKLFANVLRGKPYYPPGGNAFVDVRDVVDASFLLLESDQNKEQYIINKLNAPYKVVFTQIATKAGVKAPSKVISRRMLRFVYFIETILKIFGRKQKITKENIRAMFKTSSFDSHKIEKELAFKYRDFDDTIENTLDYYRKNKLL